MAVALKENRPVRGVEAIAERPDGTRVPFIPYPTPLHDSEGRLIGAINMLVDISERKKAEEYAGRLAAIVEFSDDAIVSKDTPGDYSNLEQGRGTTFRVRGGGGYRQAGQHSNSAGSPGRRT